MPHILKKNLKTGVIYPFYRTFKNFHEGNPLAFVGTTLPEDFYTSIGLSNKVSISAIVGYNGSGKSGLIDIVLRIVNNAGFAVL